MATQYSTILKLALPTQGELSGTWGDVVNNNITSMVEEAIAGRAVINTWSTNSHTLTTANGTTSESRCAMLEFTDTGTALSGAGTVICPTASKIYICKNDAGQTVTIKTSAGTGVAIADGETKFVFCDGTNVVEAVTSIETLSTADLTATTADINGGTIDGTVIGGSSAAAGSFTTITASGEITANGGVAFGDNDKATFGASDDLQIYHDGSNSYVQDAGSGYLVLGKQDTGTAIQNSAGQNLLITSANDVTLAYQNSAKLATTSTGVDVTGTVTSDGLVVDGDIITANAQNGLTIEYDGSGTAAISSDRTGGNYGLIQFKTTDGTAPKLRQQINYNGDISFYDDTGVSQSFFWDASAESLGIGTTSPSEKLEIFGNAILTTGYKIYGNANTGLTSSYLSLYNAVDGGIDLMANYTTSKITFGTAGSERMRIDSSGNVGIGTNLPSAKLEVNGTLYLGGRTTTHAFKTPDWQIYNTSGNALAFNNYTSDLVTITSAGNVGIGTTSPSNVLHINNSNPTIRLEDSDGSGAGIAQVQNTASGNLRLIADPNNDGAASSTIEFEVDGTERMRIDSSGNVGIGNTANNDTRRLEFTTNNGGTSAIESVTLGLTDQAMVFKTTYVTESEKMRITGQGNVGIGTSSPGTSLMVYGASGTAISLNNSTTGVTSGSGFQLQTGAGGDSYIWNYSNSFTAFATNNTERMRIDSSGNLLVGGTGTPTSSAGNMVLYNGTAPTGNATDGVILYAEDVSSSSELKVRDEAGNVTTLSPHNFDLIPEGPSEDMAWSYYSERDGKRINVDMLKAIRVLEKLSGEKLVFEN